LELNNFLGSWLGPGEQELPWEVPRTALPREHCKIGTQ
jgi:hypothetical protein